MDDTSFAIGETYRLMLWHHMEALRQKDEPKRRRYFDAIEAVAEMFPTEIAAWESQLNTEKTPT